MHDDDQRERTFYELRSRAFAASPLAPTELKALFPASSPNVTKPVTTVDSHLFCGSESQVRGVLRLAWILGDTVRLVTPHFAYRYAHTEVTQTTGYATVTSVDREFWDWRKRTLEAAQTDDLRIVPSALVDLSKTSDPIEGWSHIDTRLVHGNVQSTVISTHQMAAPDAPAIEIDLPCILVEDLTLARKVREDYPIASEELCKLLNESLDAVAESPSGADRAMLLRTIQRDIVLPRLDRIRIERNRVLKHRALSTAIEVGGLSLPLTVVHGGTVGDVLQAFLTASVGAAFAKGLNTLRDELGALRKTAAYAALKLRLDDEKSVPTDTSAKDDSSKSPR